MFEDSTAPAGLDRNTPASTHADFRPTGAPQPRRIELRLNRNRLWRWQLWLAEAMAQRAGIRLSVRLIADAPPLARALRMLLSFERLVFGLSGEHASDLLGPAAFAAYAAVGAHAYEPPDTVLDLSGMAPTSRRGERLLRPLYEGAVEEDALIGILLDGELPRLAIVDAASPDCRWAALPSAKDRRVLTRALDNVFSRLLDLCLKALVHGAEPVIGPRRPEPPAARAGVLAASAMRFAMAGIAAKANDRLVDLCGRAPRWFVGWRWTHGDPVQTRQALPSSGYRRLPDDGARWYADPFAIAVAGTHYIFCEEYDCTLGRGLISATTLGKGEPPQKPRVVLERPYHLSYPCVFAHAGQIWMIPESLEARTVELYRADPFPDKWVLEATLLSNVALTDATVFEDRGRWWMLASTSERQGSDWDALSIFCADDLFGPWLPHPQNPVLIDARAARPAGHVYRRGAHLYRPAQDCTTGYGGALALCSIDRLDPDGYAQTRQAVVTPGSVWPGRGLHTLNWAAGLEVIDGFGSPQAAA